MQLAPSPRLSTHVITETASALSFSNAGVRIWTLMSNARFATKSPDVLCGAERRTRYAYWGGYQEPRGWDAWFDCDRLLGHRWMERGDLVMSNTYGRVCRRNSFKRSTVLAKAGVVRRGAPPLDVAVCGRLFDDLPIWTFQRSRPGGDPGGGRGEGFERE